MDYEGSVSEFLVANGNTFIAPQYPVEKTWCVPDFVAIRPSLKECLIVEVSAAWDLKALAGKVVNRELHWYSKILPQLTKNGVIDASWTHDVLVFVRAERIPWFERKIGEAKEVHVWPLEVTIEPWRWKPELVRSPLFSFKGRQNVLHGLP